MMRMTTTRRMAFVRTTRIMRMRMRRMRRTMTISVLVEATNYNILVHVRRPVGPISWLVNKPPNEPWTMAVEKKKKEKKTCSWW